MPKLWTDTIEAHRKVVRDAILDATAALVDEHGVASVAMSQVAERAGIGRATLYKYFPDVESILLAWHERRVAGHLAHLAKVGEGAGTAAQRLHAVLEAYALMTRHHDGAHARRLHQAPHVSEAHRRLTGFIRDLLAEAATAGEVRTDVAAEELAGYCVHALGAASSMPSAAAARRLVQVVRAGLRPVPDQPAR